MKKLKYRRILLKISGEALMGDREFGIDPRVIGQFAEEIRDVRELGVEMGVVIGGGNIYRGVENSSDGVERVTGDQMGMLATIINGLALQGALEHHGAFTRLMSSIKMEEIAEPFIRRRALRHLEKGRIVIFGAGTGNPYFTTDTAAALRAVEIHADVIVKGTRVDGVYDADPEKNPKAALFKEISYYDVLEKDLRIMDLTSITLCKENHMPIVVLNLNKRGNLEKLVTGASIGTLVTDQSTRDKRARRS
jgi:uridylate kinase